MTRLRWVPRGTQTPVMVPTDTPRYLTPGLMGGILGTFVGSGSLIPVMRGEYSAAERRRLAAGDL